MAIVNFLDEYNILKEARILRTMQRLRYGLVDKQNPDIGII
jgi:hypothetical protein